MTIELQPRTAESDPTDAESVATPPDTEPPVAQSISRAVSIPVSTLGWSAAVGVAAIVALVLGGFLLAARSDIAHRDTVSADNKHAEQVATDYAVGAATVNFSDFNSWIGRLKSNTSPALATKFDSTAASLQQVLTPLKWTSTATPITAKVASVSGGTFKVNVFVNVTSTNAQNPDGAQTTVTYNVTVDRNADWKITDVGGMDGALPLK